MCKVVNPLVQPHHSCCFANLDDDYVDGSYTSCDSLALSIDSQMEAYEVGETIFYSKDVFFTLAKITAIALDKDNVLRYSITTSGGDEVSTMREHICSPDTPDVGWVPSSIPEYNRSAAELSEKQMEKIILISPKPVSTIAKGFDPAPHIIPSALLNHAVNVKVRYPTLVFPQVAK